MMLKSASIILLSLLSATPRAFQAGGTPLKINGRVVSAVTRRPIAGATVQAREIVMRAAQGSSESLEPVATDTNGQFSISVSREGAYLVTATAADFLPGGFGQPSPDEATRVIRVSTAQRSDAPIQLWPSRSISGHVVDEDGSAVIGAAVRLFGRDSQTNRFVAQATIETDEGGRFAFSGLRTGAFRVAVVAHYVSTQIDREGTRVNWPPNGGLPTLLSGFRAGRAVVAASDPAWTGTSPIRSEDGRISVYQTTFASDTSTIEAGIVVTAAEDITNADVRLARVPAQAVTGRLIGNSTSWARIDLLQAGGATMDLEHPLEVASTLARGDEPFVISGVPAGQYVIRASAVSSGETRQPVPASLASADDSGATVARPTNGAWSLQEISVGPEAPSDVVIEMQSGIAVSGRVEFTGSEPGLGDVNKRIVIVADPVDRSIALTSSVRRMPVFPTLKVGGSELPRGKYVVTVSATIPGWYVSAIRAGADDVMRGGLDIRDSADQLVVTLSQSTTDLNGVVRSESSSVDAASVFVFPRDRSLWSNAAQLSCCMKRARVTGSDPYSFKGLPSGVYSVVAVDGLGPLSWRDKSALARLSGVAETVTLRSGEPVSVDLVARSVVR